jgi:hypothetical protein
VQYEWGFVNFRALRSVGWMRHRRRAMQAPANRRRALEREELSFQRADEPHGAKQDIDSNNVFAVIAFLPDTARIVFR